MTPSPTTCSCRSPSTTSPRPTCRLRCGDPRRTEFRGVHRTARKSRAFWCQAGDSVNWDDLRGRRVGVYGLGREGVANVRACLARDVRPVLVDDAATRAVEGLPVLGTAAGGLEALLTCDVVVKTPGISPLEPSVAALRASGVEVVGGLGLWLAEAELSNVVCLTGTKGKSTTTALLAHLANGLGVRTLAAGNIGLPPHDPSADAASYDLVAVE